MRGQDEGNVVDIPMSRLARNHDLSLGFKILVSRCTLEEDVYISNHRKGWDIGGCEVPV